MSPITFTRSVMERFVDLLLDRLEKFTDYFIIRKHITLSETSLFIFCLAWFLWFWLRGVYVGEMIMDRTTWTALFGLMGSVHFAAFFFKDIMGRIVTCCSYAVVWCTLALLSMYTGTVAPSAPTLAVFTLMSLVVSVRLIRERRQM